MYFSNPLEPRIPNRPPWAGYAESQYDWKPSPGVYLSPIWSVAADYAGGHALLDSSVSAEGIIDFHLPIVIGLNVEGLPLITDPDAIFVINEAYNAFRRETRENIWQKGELNQANFQEFVNTSIQSWMLSHIDGLWDLLKDFSNPDLKKPLLMISRFRDPETAIAWLNETSLRRGYPMPVFYSSLPDDFVRFATQMYMTSKPVDSDRVVSLSSFTITENAKIIQPPIFLWNSEYQAQKLMYHGTTLSATLNAFPELEDSLPKEKINILNQFWEQEVLRRDNLAGEALGQMMAGFLPKEATRRNPVSKALVLVHPEPQNEIERELVCLGSLAIDETRNSDLFPKIGRYLDLHHDEYDYLVYLPSEIQKDDDAIWSSLLVHPSIKKYQDEFDVINGEDLEAQAMILKNILLLKGISEVHLAGLAFNCCVRDIAYWLEGKAEEVNFAPRGHALVNLPAERLKLIEETVLEVEILPDLTD